MALEYFPCYHSYRRKIAKLSDQEVGRLFKALLEYSETGETQELTGRESIAFDFIADDIDRAKEAYRAKCDQNRKNRNGTDDNDRQRPSTTVDERPQNKSKSKSKDKSKSKSKTNIDPFTAYAEKDSALGAALCGFAEMRVKIKKPMTDRAKSMLLTELEKLSGGDTAVMVAILDQSTSHCWQGVYELKDKAPKTAEYTPGTSELDSVAQLAARRKQRQEDNNEAL